MTSSVETTKRILGLDFLKFVCAFLVICIHTTFPGRVVVEPIARTAVPLFFMITGYNYSQILGRGKQQEQLVKILKITLYANSLYMFWELIMASISGDALVLVQSWLSIRVWTEFLILNESPFASRLWYLSALLYVLALVGWFHKKGKRGCLYKWIPVLLVTNLALGTYAPTLFGQEIPLEYSRNFLFIGLPCFLLGDYIREHIERKYLERAPSWLLLAVLVMALVTVIVEQGILMERDLLQNRDFYIFTTVIAVSVFGLVIQHEAAFEKGIFRILAVCGRKYALGIYIFNKIVRELIYKPLSLLSSEMSIYVNVLEAMSPLIVLVCTMTFVACLHRVRDYMKNTGVTLLCK